MALAELKPYSVQSVPRPRRCRCGAQTLWPERDGWHWRYAGRFREPMCPDCVVPAPATPARALVVACWGVALHGCCAAPLQLITVDVDETTWFCPRCLEHVTTPLRPLARAQEGWPWKP